MPRLLLLNNYRIVIFYLIALSKGFFIDPILDFITEFTIKSDFDNMAIIIPTTISEDEEDRIISAWENYEKIYVKFNVMISKKIIDFNNVSEIEINVSIPKTFYVLYKLSSSQNILNKLTSQHLSTNNWLLIDEDSRNYNESEIAKSYEFMREIKINSLFYVAYYRKNNETGKVYELYRISPESNITINPLLQFDNGITKIIENEFIWSRRSDLSQVHFKAAYKIEPFFFYNETSGDYGHIFGILLKILKQRLKFKIEFVPSVDGSYGGTHPNGSVKGIMGMLERKEVDFSPNSFVVTRDREKYVSFAAGFYRESTRLYMKRPDEALSWTTFVDVFNVEFWLVLGGIQMGFMIITWLAFKVLDQEKTIGLGESIVTPLLSMGALSIPEMPKRAPGRILILNICMTGALVFWCYNAGLISKLTLQHIEIPIKTMEDILNNGDYQILVQADSAISEGFKNADPSTSKTMYDLYKTQIEGNSDAYWSDIQEGNDKVLNNPKYIILSWKMMTEINNPEYPCNLVTDSLEYFTLTVAWPFVDDSPYIPIFNYEIEKLLSAGIFHKLFTAKKEEARIERECTKSDFIPIGFNNILSAFVILALGIGVSFLLLIIENILIKFLE